MARPIKKGLDYFPFDVDFFSDKKIKRLRAKFGNDGVMVYIYLLCEIYREGYYIDYDDDLILDISDELNISENSTMQILNYLLSRSLLDDKLAKSVKVLTAKSIQRRYLKAKSGSVHAVIEERFSLVKSDNIATSGDAYPEDSFFENNGGFFENNPNYSAKNHTKESKVKKSKVKESKEEESSSAPPLRTYGEFGHVKLTDEQYQNLVQQYGATNIKKYIRKMDDYLETKHTTYDNCYIKLRQWLDKDNVKKEFSDGFDPEKYKAFINNV